MNTIRMNGAGRRSIQPIVIFFFLSCWPSPATPAMSFRRKPIARCTTTAARTAGYRRSTVADNRSAESAATARQIRHHRCGPTCSKDPVCFQSRRILRRQRRARKTRTGCRHRPTNSDRALRRDCRRGKMPALEPLPAQNRKFRMWSGSRSMKSESMSRTTRFSGLTPRGAVSPGSGTGASAMSR